MPEVGKASARLATRRTMPASQADRTVSWRRILRRFRARRLGQRVVRREAGLTRVLLLGLESPRAFVRLFGVDGAIRLAVSLPQQSIELARSRGGCVGSDA